MPLAKRLRRPPREVAAEIVARLDLADLCQPPEIAGPGFINLRIRDDWLVEQLTAAVGDPRLGVAPVAQPRTFVDRLLRPQRGQADARGPHPLDRDRRRPVPRAAVPRPKVISDNHIGDWGTQFGMIIYGYKHFLDAEAYRRNPVEELARLYRLCAGMIEEQSKSDRGRRSPSRTSPRPCWPRRPSCTPAIAENRRLWQEFLPFCEDEIERMYGGLASRSTTRWARAFTTIGWPAMVEELLAHRRPASPGESDRGARVRASSKARQSAHDRAEAGRGVPVRHHRPGHDPLSHGNLAARRDSLRGRSSPVAAFPAAFRRRATAGLHGRGVAARQFRHRAGRRRPALQDPLRRHRGPGRLLDEAVRRAVEIVSANDDAKPDGPELSAEQRRASGRERWASPP